MQIFEPKVVGKIVLKNSIIRSATHDGLSDKVHEGPSQELIRKYAYLAKKEVGCIIAGYAIVSPEGRSNYPKCLGFFNDNAKDSYCQLTKAVHEYSTPIIAQLAHCGRQTSSKKIGMQKIAPSAKRHLFYPDKAKEMTIDEIISTEDKFVRAIEKAKEYGFDGVQLHLAHGYLLHDFISANGNKRKDEYGGNINNRLRIVKNILQKARKSVGDFPIWVKLSAVDNRKNGMRIDYSVEVAKLLKEYGVDAIEVSCGSVQDGMSTMRAEKMPMDAVFAYKEPLASMPKFLNKAFLLPAKLINPLISQPKPLRLYNVEWAKIIHEKVGIDTIVVGGISKLSEVQNIIDSGIDAVSMCRPFICEPDLVYKWKNGKQNDSKCIMCNFCGLVIEKEKTRCLMGKVPNKNK